jgi:hypothetical protein
MIALLLAKHARPRLQWDSKCLNVQQWGEQPWFPKLESIIAVANEELSVSTTSPDVHAERKDFIVVKHNSKQDQPYLELTISRTDLPSHVRGIEFQTESHDQGMYSLTAWSLISICPFKLNHYRDGWSD